MTQRRAWLSATSAVPGRFVQVLACISLVIAAACAISGAWPGLGANLGFAVTGWLLGWRMVRDARKRKALAAELDELAATAARLLAAEIARQRIDLCRRNARWS